MAFPRGFCAPKRRDLTGMTFGKLTVIEEAPKCGHYWRWKCKCACGSIQLAVREIALLRGDIQSCGCLTGDTITKKHGLRPYEALYRRMLYNIKRKGLLTDITYEDFAEFAQIKECHYCGSRINWQIARPQNKGNRSVAYNLDRKDNSGNYTLRNVVVCCFPCNSAKGARFTYGEWLCMATALRAYRARNEAQDGVS